MLELGASIGGFRKSAMERQLSKLRMSEWREIHTKGSAASSMPRAVPNSKSSLSISASTVRASSKVGIRKSRAAVEAARSAIENPLLACPPIAKILALSTR